MNEDETDSMKYHNEIGEEKEREEKDISKETQKTNESEAHPKSSDSDSPDVIYKEELQDEDGFERPDVSYFNLVHIILWVLLLIWELILGFTLLVLSFIDIESKNTPIETLENFHYSIGLLGPYIMAPTHLHIPPIFRTKLIRQKLRICLNVLTILCFLIFAISGIFWAFFVDSKKLMRLATILSFQLIASAAVMFGLISLLRIDVREYRNREESRQCSGRKFTHEFLVFLGSLTILSIETGLVGNRKYIKIEPEEESDSVTYLIPLFLQCWLFLLYQQHYLSEHIGWYTYDRCRAKVNDNIEMSRLSPLERAYFHRKSIGTKLIEGSLQTKLMNRNFCPC